MPTLAPMSGAGENKLKVVDFPGKYEVVTAAEREMLSDDELVKLIMERANVSDAHAREVLAGTRPGPPYHRV